MMQATDIIHDIILLPVSQTNVERMLIVEQILRSTRHEEQLPLEKAAECLYADYCNDKELALFTQLDCEDFYA